VAPTRGWARLYCNVCAIDCESKVALDELLAALSIDQWVVQRISDRTILVDGLQRNQITRALARLGNPYRIVDLPPVNPEAPAGGGRA
jgi:hypothetical protein